MLSPRQLCECGKIRKLSANERQEYDEAVRNVREQPTSHEQPIENQHYVKHGVAKAASKKGARSRHRRNKCRLRR